MRRIAAAVVLVTACVIGGVVLMLIPLSIPGSYPPVSGDNVPAPIESCPAGMAGTSWGTLLSSPPDVQLHPREAYQFGECHDAAVQRAVQAGGLGGLGVLVAVALLVWKPGLLDQVARSRRRGGAADQPETVLAGPVGLAASVLGVGCLLGGFLWIAASV